MSSTTAIDTPGRGERAETDNAGSPKAPESRALSISSLVLGLASILFSYTLLVPIGGIVLGALALKREPASKTMSIWGIVLSSANLVGTLLAVVFGLSLLAVLGLAESYSWVFPAVR